MIPVVNYSNANGFSLGAMGQMFYKINKNDSILPVSSSGVFASYTNNGTWFGALFQRFYINEDRWSIVAALGAENVNDQYYQEILIFGGGKFIDFKGKNVVGEDDIRSILRNVTEEINFIHFR